MTRLSNFVTKSLKIAGFLFFSSPVFANEICERFYKEPVVSTNINYGSVRYKSVPKSDIMKFDKLKNPEATLGLTKADFSIKYDFGFEKYKIDEGVCTIISSINFSIGYKDIDVLIEDKYEKGSCEYNAIKEHENGHVDIYKKELKYYGNLVLDELKRIAGDVGPMFFDGKVSGKKIGNKIRKVVFENSNINILKSKLEKALINKNSAYDSKDEYLRVKGLCKNW
ncbi:MAG: hypothetical protein IJ638_01240 [Alphaproteobacteria bacterium]|nr:hypothetical protein [Alphaproteobacteria bacterium]